MIKFIIIIISIEKEQLLYNQLKICTKFFFWNIKTLIYVHQNYILNISRK